MVIKKIMDNITKRLIWLFLDIGEALRGKVEGDRVRVGDGARAGLVLVVATAGAETKTATRMPWKQ